MPSLHQLAKLAVTGLGAVPWRVQGFEGKGQLRTVWWQGDHADLGCLTSAGLWTADEKLCGVFEAARADDDRSLFTLSTEDGWCRIYGAQFTCNGQEAYSFGTWPENWPNGIPGVQVLRFGQYGIMASSGRNPPEVVDKPQEIHFTSYNEVGKYVWLTWMPL